MAKFTYSQNNVVAKTTKGTVRGYETNGISVFKGIPYATAKRFHKPQPCEPWADTLECTSFGYVCPLLDLGKGKPNGEMLVPHRYWPMNEDCLNLNVWTPALDGKKRPVLVWFHGGGFFAGSSIEHIAYEGENMARLGDVVVVSVNHRLNVLGYFDLSQYGEEYEDSGNNGSRDLVASLQWVHDNIENFGGDSGNVTIFGQSGGGAKVTTMLQTPEADGLFHKGIVMSGVIGPILADQKGDSTDMTEMMLKELGLKDVKELETVPYEQLAPAYQKCSAVLAPQGKYVGGAPRLNPPFYMGEPQQNGFRPESAHVPLMVGSVFGEFLSFAPGVVDKHAMSFDDQLKLVRERMNDEVADKLVPMMLKAYPERCPVDILTIDFIFRAPEIPYNQLRAKGPAPVYAYLFNQDMPLDGGRTPWHCSDIPYFFHNSELAPYTQIDGVSDRLEEQMFQSFMAFARTGNPNNNACPEWPACTPDEEHVMLFDADSRVVTNHDHELIAACGAVIGPLMMQMMAQGKGPEVQH